MKGYRKLLSVMLVCSMLVAMPSSEAFAADAAAEVNAETEENVMESDIGTEEKEEPETENMASERDGGEKEAGETVSEDNGSEDAGEGTEGNEADEPKEEAAEPGKETADPVDILPREEHQEEQAEAVMAETTSAEGGETSGSCGANVIWKFEDGVLTISGSGAMEDYQSPHDVNGKSAPWYKYHRNNIKRVVVEEGVTTIGGYAFYVCLKLTSIELPSSITTIGEFAFNECGGLTSIELPSGVTAIGESAFNNCWSLTDIELPSGVTIIEAGTFEWCQSLTDIELPSGVTSIGREAFWHCNSLTDIELPSGVTAIGESAFSGCSNLTNIKLPSGVTIIEKGTFAVCDSLTSIELPPGITIIGANAFYACDSLASIVLPVAVTAIGESAFAECRSLTDVYYGGSESDWRAITIGDNNEPLTSAHYNSSSPIHIYCGNQTTENFTHNLDYYVTTTSSDTYSPQLSHMLIAMSCAAYDEGNVKASMKELGFKDSDIFCQYNKDDWDRQISYAFGKRTMPNGETLVLVAVRGSSSSFDWLSNCNVGVGSWHMGFELAVNEVYASLTDFMGGNLNGATYVVTGHSRGAAVANLLEMKLFEAKVANKKVYGYNFACPDVARAVPTMWNWLGEHNNMFNIGNAPDPVTMVPGVLGGSVGFIPGTSWGKFGQSRWFSTDWNNINEIALNFSKHDPKAYLEHLRDKPSFDSFKTYEQRMMTISASELRTIGRLFGIQCPVDVNITDQNGNMVASVIGGEVNYYGSSFGEVMIFTDGDKKAVFVQGNDPLEIHLTATDGGTMAYTVQTLDFDLGEVLSEKVFDNVALADDKQMLSIVDTKEAAGNGTDVSQVQLLVLDEDDNIVREVLPDGTGTEIPYTGPNEVLPGDIPADGKIPDGLWIAGVADSYTYTGAAIKPEIRVYDGKKRLQPGKDYTASYKNNMKANDAANPSTAPAVVVKGRGNYAGTETAAFQITSVALEDSSVVAEDITVACNKKVQKKVPVVTYNGRKLAKNRDFTVSYPSTATDAYKEPGNYEILLTAKAGGNFSGTRMVTCTITDRTLLGKVNVKKIPNQTYTGKAIEPELTVTYKNTPLIKGTDYVVSYTDHTEVGTAKVVLTGIGKYAGTRSVSFKITGTSLKGAVLSGIVNKTYNGSYQRQSMTVALHGRTLVEGTDYEVAYANNKDVGKASVTIKGKGAYTGTVKKTFQIGKFDIAANMDGRFTAEVKQEAVPYAKGGAKPTVAVRFRTGDGRWQTLAEGRDYTLSYRNHTALNDGSRADRRPVVTVKGKGSFRGIYGIALGYKIMAQDIGQLTLTAQDKTYQNRKNVFTTKVAVTDLDGKVLKAGTDYNKTVVYTYAKETAVITAGGGTAVRAAGEAVDKNDIIPAGTVLKVQVQAKEGSNYTGMLTGEYRITQAAISSASVSVPKQVYTGQPITLEKSMLTVKVKGKPLDVSQYEIVPGSYKNNVKKGTASVTIRGVDNYGGTKNVRFTIRARGFLWWWR